MLKRVSRTIANVTASDRFFYLVLFVFALQAAWLAVSAAYPLMYDELYHAGFIDVYSSHWLPFIESQSPEQTAIYNDIVRNTSYLFHYLLSFPYRLIASFTDSFYIKIVSLRLINVALVFFGLILFRRLFQLLKIPRHVAHVSLLVLVLVPIFPFVAAHINYDNLLFLLAPMFFILAVRLTQTNKLDFKYGSLLVLVGLLACLVKYTFLPVLAATVAYVIFVYAKNWQTRRPLEELRRTFRKLSLVTRVLISLLLFVSVGLFTERYVYNLVKYQEVTPACHKVHEKQECDRNGLVSRGKKARMSFAENPTTLMNVVDYIRLPWLRLMVDISLLVIVNTGHKEALGNSNKVQAVGSAIEYLHSFMWVALTLSVIFVSYSWRQLKKMPHFWLIVMVFLVYLFAVLVYTNYAGYRKHGQLFAIQPRYFIILAPLLIVYIVQAANLAVRRTSSKVVILLITLVMFTQGGGMLTYIVRSDPSWYWQREKIININMGMKRVISPFIKESNAITK